VGVAIKMHWHVYSGCEIDEKIGVQQCINDLAELSQNAQQLGEVIARRALPLSLHLRHRSPLSLIEDTIGLHPVKAVDLRVRLFRSWQGHQSTIGHVSPDAHYAYVKVGL
jgi:hypothetical protein